MTRRLIVLSILCTLRPGFVPACSAQTDYARDIRPVLKAKCFSCHGAIRQEAGLRVDTAARLVAGGESGRTVNQKSVDASLILQRVTAGESERMPPEGTPLTAAQIKHLRQWITEGAVAPETDPEQPDPGTHWAFQPIPGIAADERTIDDHVTRQLRTAGLQPNPPADTRTLIRRLFLDLHGLPPSPEQMLHWQDRIGISGRSAQAVQELVDLLLDSPRYGERWAQHWLDVVRYADTHGYEVNTPRPNAWPYRDYVIRAFNEDKPYNEFVLDQIAGDATGEDAATGFLVAAAVLLPGQIGKDEPSKRLARQDALDEIVVGTSATFLGLTIGCARCHDHKFDPFSQEDYYALQAFFAGVEYGDRPLKSADDNARKAEAAALRTRINGLSRQLRAFEPEAFRGRTIVIDDEDLDAVTVLTKKNGHGTNPAGTQRGYRDDPGAADRLPNISRSRYTWWPNHAGEDVLTWNPSVHGRYRLWISWGAHGSGVHTRDARYVLDHDGRLETREDQIEVARVDQYYMAGISEGESERKPLWSGLLDAGVHEFNAATRLVLRGGDTGTGITADVIVLQESLAERPAPSPLPGFRAPVDSELTVERFAPVTAQFVRFTTLETIDDNRHEPCLDELEVFLADAPETNVALAESGTRATSSGNYSNTGKHQLKHVNDGRYSNDRSWISNEKGGGWVQLEFPQQERIGRIEWARDRTGKFRDRLPVKYVIEVSADGQSWSPVAGSTDRLPVGTPFEQATAVSRSTPGVGAEDPASLLSELKSARARKDALEAPRMVYGGRFRAPDITHLLSRGDPEQPEDIVAPHVPAALGDLVCRADDSEQQRRLRLARWLVDEANPLTARVMVNRVWQYHFGRGLVDTASDFGLNGAAPVNQELLDSLARRFMESGWSVKWLHRQILLTETWQQSSQNDTAAAQLDSDSRLLWRFPSRRLEAEAIRDSVLAVSGRLNLKMGGPGFDFFKTRGGLSGFPPVESFESEGLRRMVYAHRIRMEPAPVFGAFDCPDAGQPTPRRTQSTTAIQALNLFNSPFMLEQAEAMAARVVTEAGGESVAQIERAWLLTTGRPPSATERQACLVVVEKHGLASVCRALLNSNEFLFIP